MLICHQNDCRNDIFWQVFSGGCAMIVDSGTTLIYGPTTIMTAMAKLYGGTFNSNLGQYEVSGPLKILIGDWL